jgi:hypothetical protein
VVDINASIVSNHEIMNDLLALHGLSGCDTVALYYGIGKSAAFRVLKDQNIPLVYLETLSMACQTLQYLIFSI